VGEYNTKIEVILSNVLIFVTSRYVISDSDRAVIFRILLCYTSRNSIEDAEK